MLIKLIQKDTLSTQKLHDYENSLELLENPLELGILHVQWEWPVCETHETNKKWFALVYKKCAE